MRKRGKFDAMREDAIDRILHAAMDLFAKYGYAATTVQMIADRAGVVPSGIYHYYAGKADLLVAVVDKLMQKLEGTIADSLEERFQTDDIFSFIDFCMQKLRENVSEVRLLSILLMQQDTPSECAEKLEVISFIGERLSKYFYGTEALQRATEIVEDLLSVIMLYTISGNETILEHQIRRVKEYIHFKYADCIDELTAAAPPAVRA